jgi:hypothetical protein
VWGEDYQKGAEMIREKQIEEMASDIEQSGMLDSLSRCRIVAEELYFKGYRKQSENVVELPCKAGDYVHFKGLETPWKVSAIHIYEEGQPQISITSETGKITSTMTANEFYMLCFVIADAKMKGGE